MAAYIQARVFKHMCECSYVCGESGVDWFLLEEFINDVWSDLTKNAGHGILLDSNNAFISIISNTSVTDTGNKDI